MGYPYLQEQESKLIALMNTMSNPQTESLKGATTKALFNVDEIKKYLDEQIIKWTKLLNSDYQTDSGHRLDLHSGGRLEAAIEMKSFITKLEKKNDQQI